MPTIWLFRIGIVGLVADAIGFVLAITHGLEIAAILFVIIASFQILFLNQQRVKLHKEKDDNKD
jgi:hypothetical protein